MAIQKSEIESGIATAIISAIILAVLLLCGMTAHRNEMDEGIMVSFGDALDGQQACGLAHQIRGAFFHAIEQVLGFL